MAKEENGPAQPLLRSPNTVDGRTAQGTGDALHAGSQRANYESCAYTASRGAPTAQTAHITHSDSSSMDHLPVTLSWEDVNVFVREEKKQKKNAVSVEVDAETGAFARAGASKNGHKQIISNGKCGNIYLFLCVCVRVCTTD